MSLFVHGLVFWSPDFSPQSMLGMGGAKMQVSLRAVPKDRVTANPTVPGSAPAVTAFAKPKRPKIAQIPRSTAIFHPKSTINPALATNANKTEITAPEESDVAAYRLALARSAGRLLPPGLRGNGVTGELVFELIKLPGNPQSSLRMQSSTVDKGLSDDLLAVMQLAVSQTAMPADWAGRQFKISLHLQLTGNELSGNQLPTKYLPGKQWLGEAG